MYIDIKQLVCDALMEQGCSDSLLQGIDGHSTIALEFNDRPDILISEMEGEVWLWSRIAEDNQLVIGQRSGELLYALMEGCSFTPGGQLQLAIDDNYILLRGLIDKDFLQSGKLLSAALEEFFNLQDNFLRIIL